LLLFAQTDYANIWSSLLHGLSLLIGCQHRVSVGARHEPFFMLPASLPRCPIADTRAESPKLKVSRLRERLMNDTMFFCYDV